MPIVCIILSVSFIIKDSITNTIYIVYILLYLIYLFYYILRYIYIYLKEQHCYKNKNKYKKVIIDLIYNKYRILLYSKDINIHFELYKKNIINCIVELLIDKNDEKSICTELFEIKDLLKQKYKNYNFIIFYKVKKNG